MAVESLSRNKPNNRPIFGEPGRSVTFPAEQKKIKLEEGIGHPLGRATDTLFGLVAYDYFHTHRGEGA
jgi:hypothetical protein